MTVSVDDIIGGERITFGVTPPFHDDVIPELEAAGAESLWAGGHIAAPNPAHEAMIFLARLSVQATVPIGTGILLLPLYSPAIVAKQVADLDNLTGGRILLGVGVGGEFPAEFSAVQVPVRERGRRTDEAIPLLRRVWTAEPVTHHGPAFPMDGVRVHPAPLQPGGPPIIVAGRQDAAMRRAAVLGDGWMPYMYSPRRYGESVARIREHAAAAGRSLDRFVWMVYVPTCVDADSDRARRDAVTSLGGTYNQDFEKLIGHVGAVGTPAEVAARLGEYVDSGARHFTFLLARRDGAGAVEQSKLLAEEVMPLVRAGVHAS